MKDFLKYLLQEEFNPDNGGAIVIDGIGDVLVTLIIVAEQLGLTLTECLAVAYLEIKDRKGRLVNGTFIKEES